MAPPLSQFKPDELLINSYGNEGGGRSQPRPLDIREVGLATEVHVYGAYGKLRPTYAANFFDLSDPGVDALSWSILPLKKVSEENPHSN